jgi:hypothetical protein
VIFLSKDIEKQQENIRTLLVLVHENPDLRIIPMVDTECVVDDCCAWWVSSWGKATIEEIYFNYKQEKVYIKAQDYDSLVDEEYDKFFGANIDDETAMKLAREKVDAYSWENVIAVTIEP